MKDSLKRIIEQNSEGGALSHKKLTSNSNYDANDIKKLIEFY